MPMALEGIRVLDLSQFWAGPGVGMYLADQGAEVIKVEPPGGDDARRLNTSPYLGQDSRSFMVLNRNKRGMRLDITKEQGKEIVYQLVERCDVLIENFRPGVAERLGLGYEELSGRNPSLIYASISGYGERGPYASYSAYDRILQGLSGIMASRRLPDGYPLTAGVWVADCAAPMLVAYGIMLALWVREKTGLGQRVKTSLLDLAIAMQSVDLVRVDADPTPFTTASQATYAAYQCQDGEFINVVVLNERQWQRLCQALEVEHLATDPRFDSVPKRAERREELFPIMDGLFRLKPSQEWLRILREADVPCGPIITREQVFREPQILENEMVVALDHPVVGKTRMMGIPIRLSGTPGRIRHPAPTLGQHTEEVLRWLGYSGGEIQELRQQEVI